MPTATPTWLGDRIRRRFAPEVGATSRHSSIWVSDARPRLAMRVIAWFVPPSSPVTAVRAPFELPCPPPTTHPGAPDPRPPARRDVQQRFPTPKRDRRPRGGVRVPARALPRGEGD